MTTEAAPRGVGIGLAGIALLVCMGGLLYAYLQSIPASFAVPLAAAFAFEAVWYSIACWGAARGALERRLQGAALAAVMALSGVLPYLLYAPFTGLFRWDAVLELTGVVVVLSFWYVVLPRKAVIDVLFFVAVAAAVIARPFEAIYGVGPRNLQLAILGQLMWTRLAITVALSIARVEVKGFGLAPSRQEWRIGLAHFLMFVPVGALLSWATGFAGYHPRVDPWWRTAGVTAGTFLGMLWLVALREEFFFRGLIQEWAERWMRSAAAIALTSVAFGLVHLPFREFPNWRFAILAAAAGVFYGRAYLQARSVRAAMVTHALVNTAWRVFFS